MKRGQGSKIIYIYARGQNDPMCTSGAAALRSQLFLLQPSSQLALVQHMKVRLHALFCFYQMSIVQALQKKKKISNVLQKRFERVQSANPLERDLNKNTLY